MLNFGKLLKISSNTFLKTFPANMHRSPGPHKNGVQAIYDSNQGRFGFILTPEEYGVEIRRRYDINNNNDAVF